MKKLVYLLSLMLVLTSSFVLADISISDPLDIYNLGDRLYITADGIIGTDSGNLNINLVCGNQTTILVKIPARAFSGDEALSYPIPYKILNTEDLEIDNLNNILGECQVTASIGTGVASTKTFTISSNVIVTASLDKPSYNPGETINVNIAAIKENGVLLNGFVEGSNASSFNRAIEGDSVDEVFSMPETAEAGNYILTVRAYDTGRNGVLNEGFTSVSFNINHIASSIILSLSDVMATPGESFTIGAEVFDQSGVKMNGIVSVEIISPNGEIIDSTVPNNDFASIDFPYNSTLGTWTIIASFNNLREVRELEMSELQKVEFEFEDSVLSITNIGNTLYNKTISIKIGEEITELDLNIKVGEVRKFNIDAPNGEYEIIIGDGDSSITRQVLLTGNAIKISDLKEVGIFKGYSVVWIFLILVLGGIGVVLFMRYRQTKTLGEDGILGGLFKKSEGIIRSVTGNATKVKDGIYRNVPTKIKSRMGDSLNFTNKSPGVQGLDQDNYSHEDKTMVDFTKKDSMSAESALVLKGEKYVSSVISLSVKNHDKLSDVAKDALHNAVAGAQKKKGLVDWRGDYIFIVFSPIITKTYKNESLAAKEGMEILNSLNEYNKKFKDKIQFGIGIHYGELISSKEGGKLKYTSIGNTISLAKRISDSENGKLLISDDIRKKLLRDLKVVRGKDIGDNPTYEVEEVKDHSADAARLKDLLKRTSS